MMNSFTQRNSQNLARRAYRRRVMTTKTAGAIIDLLEGQTSTGADEEARKIYVAASRAERLLAIATPKSRATALKAILDVGGRPVQVVTL